MSEPTVHVVCLHCQTTNRIPVQSAGKELRCGRCQNLLFGEPPPSVDATMFDAQITRSELPVVVDFWAAWCGPCRMMAPAFEQVSAQWGPRARFLKVDTEAQQALALRYQIRSIPTLAVFRGGREIARQAGAMSAGQLTHWLQSALP